MSNIEIRPMLLEDQDALRTLYCWEYIAREPLHRNLEVHPEVGGSSWFLNVFPRCLEEGLSVVAIDSDTREIVGSQAIGILYKDKPRAASAPTDNPKTRGNALVHEAVANASSK